MKRLFALSMVGFVAVALVGCEAKLPEFAGVYVVESGKYREVPRIKNSRELKFNLQHRGGFMSGTDYNVKAVLGKDQFIPVSLSIINTKGFLVVQNKEWSEIKLFRVPNTGYLKDNEKGTEIVTAVSTGGGWGGMLISDQGLLPKMEPREVEIKQAQKGPNAFIYMPSAPLEKGYYLIDYKVNGQNQKGWNPIVAQ